MPRAKMTDAALEARHDRLTKRFGVLTDLMVECREELRHLERQMIDRQLKPTTEDQGATLDFASRRTGNV